MSALLEVEQATKIYRQRGKEDFTALEEVSFTLAEGETLGIVGESGSGKSTLAKAIVRLLDLTSGKITFDSLVLTSLKKSQMRPIYRDIQMVFQSPAGSFDPRKTLGNSISEVMRNYGASRKEAARQVGELLGKCGLPTSYASKFPHEVSGGECQRASIARAIALQPKLILFDEATSALDVTVQKNILFLLKSLQEEFGLSYLFISHDLAVVQQVCDRVIVMKEGKIVETGSTDQVIQNPAHAYTRQLIEAVL